MTETKWTPGNWKLEPATADDDDFSEGAHLNYVLVSTDDTNSPRSHRGLAAVVVGLEGHQYAEGEANAHLIAAAPELYEALVSLDDRLRECGPIHTAEDAYDSFYQEMVSEALARARGEQP